MALRPNTKKKPLQSESEDCESFLEPRATTTNPIVDFSGTVDSFDSNKVNLFWVKETTSINSHQFDTSVLYFLFPRSSKSALHVSPFWIRHSEHMRMGSSSM